MFIKIQKWGNSLALRIPKSFATELKISEDSEVNLSLENGKLIIKPTNEKKYELNDLLSQVNEKNIHGEYTFGRPEGNELW
jgi:antitoxin MazE